MKVLFKENPISVPYILDELWVTVTDLELNRIPVERLENFNNLYLNEEHIGKELIITINSSTISEDFFNQLSPFKILAIVKNNIKIDKGEGSLSTSALIPDDKIASGFLRSNVYIKRNDNIVQGDISLMTEYYPAGKAIVLDNFSTEVWVFLKTDLDIKLQTHIGDRRYSSKVILPNGFLYKFIVDNFRAGLVRL